MMGMRQANTGGLETDSKHGDRWTNPIPDAGSGNA